MHKANKNSVVINKAEDHCLRILITSTFLFHVCFIYAAVDFVFLIHCECLESKEFFGTLCAVQMSMGVSVSVSVSVCVEKDDHSFGLKDLFEPLNITLTHNSRSTHFR